MEPVLEPLEPFETFFMDVRRNDLKAVQRQLDRLPLLVRSETRTRYQAIHLAALHGHQSMLDLLLDAGANLNARHGSTMRTPLMMACSNPNAEATLGVVARLLERGANVLLASQTNTTPIMLAAAVSSPAGLQRLQLLVKHVVLAAAASAATAATAAAAAAIDAVDPRSTAGIEQDHERTDDDEEEQLEHEASLLSESEILAEWIDRRNDHASSAVLIAATQGALDNLVLLLDTAENNGHRWRRWRRAAKNMENESGGDELDWVALAARLRLTAEARAWKRDASQVMLEDCPPRAGDALISAALAGENATVKFLLACGVSVDYTDNDQWTPLLAAVQGGHSSTVELLLKVGASPTIANVRRITPLMLSVILNRPELGSLLLDHGAPINQPTHVSATALSFAASLGHLDAATMLLERGATVDAHRVQDGISIGATPLYEAVSKGNIAMMRLLLKYGASLTFTRGIEATGLLLAAVKANQYDATLLLLDEGLPVTTCSASGEYPIHAAAHIGNAKILRLLLERDANPDTRRMHIEPEVSLMVIDSMIAEARATSIQQQPQQPQQPQQRQQQQQQQHQTSEVTLEQEGLGTGL